MAEEHPEAASPAPEAVEETVIPAAETAGNDGDAGEEAAGGKKVTIPAPEYAALVEKTKRLKAIEDENAALRDRATRTTTDNRGSSEVDEQRKALDEEKTLLRKLEWAAEQGDDYAKANLLAMRRSVAAEERSLYRLELSEIDKEDRKDVESLMRERGIRSPKVAAELLRGGSRYETLAQENARLKAEIEKAKKPKAAVTSTRIEGDTLAGRAKREGDTEYVSTEEYLKRTRDPKTKAATIAAMRAKTLRIR